MTKLYLKNELLFAILFIVVYVVGAAVLDAVSDMVGISKVFTLPFLFIVSLIVFVWVKKQNLMQKYGLCKPEFTAKKFLFYIPLLILISTNFWFGVKLNFSWLETIFNVLSMLLVGFLEEIIFRGFLFKAMEKDSVKPAIIVSSLTFGIGHIINLLTGGFSNIVANLCQVCYATAVGFLFVIMFYKGGSLIPCILTHSLVNAASVFQNATKINNTAEILISLAIIVVAVVYTVILLKTLKPKSSQVNNVEPEIEQIEK